MMELQLSDGILIIEETPTVEELSQFGAQTLKDDFDKFVNLCLTIVAGQESKN